MNNFGAIFATVIGSIITLSIISVLISKNSQTGSVITAGGSALSSVIGAAVSPVTGNNGNLGLSSFTSPGIASGFNI